MTAKPRSRPTKFYVHDEQAIHSLLTFGLNHRMAVADHCAKQIKTVSAVGDRLSLAVECFMAMMANIEDLEKTYFALKRKAAGERKSLFELFANTGVKERRGKRVTNERSARVLRSELDNMSIKVFCSTLGLPAFEEWLPLGHPPSSLPRAEARLIYNRDIRTIMRRMRTLAKNRASHRLMDVYNKCKHGFVALHSSSPPGVFLIEKAYGKRHSACWVQCLPFQASDGWITKLVGNTRQATETMRVLFTLYGRIPDEP